MVSFNALFVSLLAATAFALPEPHYYPPKCWTKCITTTSTCTSISVKEIPKIVSVTKSIVKEVPVTTVKTFPHTRVWPYTLLFTSWEEYYITLTKHKPCVKTLTKQKTSVWSECKTITYHTPSTCKIVVPSTSVCKITETKTFVKTGVTTTTTCKPPYHG